MTGKRTLLLITFTLLLMSPGFGQTCGDANGDDKVDISDLVYVIEYIGYPNGGPEPVDSASVEWDDHIGITISDVMALIDYIFVNYDTLICGATQPYSFAPSSSDTIFLPAMYDIPDGLDKVQLPISFSLDTNTVGFYYPIQLGTGSGAIFELDSIHSHSSASISGGYWQNPDTTVLRGFELSSYEIVRQGVGFTLHYSRVSDGIANIETELVDLAGARKWAVSKGDGDLYRPVFVNVDIAIPPDSLTVSETDIDFETMAGNQSLDSFYVDFGSTGMPVQFNLVPSEAWIMIQGSVMPVLWTTPANVLVTVDSDQMPVGTHTGRIDIIPEDSSVVIVPDFIDVTLTVYEPNLYPNGDLDCNGIIDLGDLTYMIAYLFIGGPPPQPCQ